MHRIIDRLESAKLHRKHNISEKPRKEPFFLSYWSITSPKQYSSSRSLHRKKNLDRKPHRILGDCSDDWATMRSGSSQEEISKQHLLLSYRRFSSIKPKQVKLKICWQSENKNKNHKRNLKASFFSQKLEKSMGTKMESLRFKNEKSIDRKP